jgi:hypothetical protein
MFGRYFLVVIGRSLIEFSQLSQEDSIGIAAVLIAQEYLIIFLGSLII